jgi:hypothetical protein
MLILARLARGSQLERRGVLTAADPRTARVVGGHGGMMSDHRLSHRRLM